MIINYFTKKRFVKEKRQLKRSEVRFLKLFALTLFNDIKVQCIMGAKLDFQTESLREEFDNYKDYYSCSFDTNLSFYKEFFWMLSQNSFEDIISENSHQLLWPLVDKKKQETGNLKQLWSIGLKLYQTNIEEEAEITIIETRERKTFSITTKGKAFGEHRKNPTLNGDFGVIIKIKNKTYTCWLNFK